MTSFPLNNQPYKVAKEDRIFKGIVACGLSDLIEKSLKSLDIPNDKSTLDNIQVFLDEDGTIVDDNDYFSSLEKNTKLIIKNKSSPYKDYASKCDKDESYNTDFVDGPSQFISIALKKKLIQKDLIDSIMVFVTMSNEELEYLVDCDINLLKHELGVDHDMARLYIDNATKELLRREELLNASKLINLYQKAKDNISLSGDLNMKRQRSDF